MKGNSTDGVSRQVRRLFDLGAVGTLTDSQLLDWYLSQRDEASEAAFEELMIRHGPMVLRVCRGVLGDAHDAEDAFQAAFLVLAHRAGAIHRRGSIASWLFGVANRVASRAKIRATRRRRNEERVVQQRVEGHFATDRGADWEVLHEEINGLPERLRAPIVLCYLEGMTYGAGACQLGIPEATLRGRLVRARERLRHRLTRRGFIVPAGLLFAGSTAHAQVVVPAALAHSTIRIGQGFMTGNTAASLARAILKSMMLKQLRLVTLLVILGTGYCCWLWTASAMGIGNPAKPFAGRVARRPASASPFAAPKQRAIDPTVPYRIGGSVRVEDTGEPVAGVKLRIDRTDFYPPLGPGPEEIETDVAGQFAVNLPAGHVRYLISRLPRGYWVPRGQPSVGMLALGPEEPLIHKDCLVRRGNEWTFQVTRGADQKPVPGFVTGFQSWEAFMARADDRGEMHLTLPPEERKVTLSIWESCRWESSSELSLASTGSVLANLEWEAHFRPDQLQSISRMEGEDRRFRLIDADGKTASIHAPLPIEPVNRDGKLVIRVALSERGPKDLGVLEGRVLDETGLAIRGADVTLETSWGEGVWGGGEEVSNEPRHHAQTDERGGYHLPGVPRWTIDDKPLKARVRVRKEGYAGRETPLLTLGPDEQKTARVLEPIQLERGVSLGGFVVDHRGRPVAGAWVRAHQRPRDGGASGITISSTTDRGGRFILRDLRRGLAQLNVFYGRIQKGNSYLADGSPIEVRVELPERPIQERQ